MTIFEIIYVICFLVFSCGGVIAIGICIFTGNSETLGFGIGCFVLVGVLILGYSSGRQNIQKKAIAAGVAKYTVNSETGETTFEFVNANTEK